MSASSTTTTTTTIVTNSTATGHNNAVDTPKKDSNQPADGIGVFGAANFAPFGPEHNIIKPNGSDYCGGLLAPLIHKEADIEVYKEEEQAGDKGKEGEPEVIKAHLVKRSEGCDDALFEHTATLLPQPAIEKKLKQNEIRIKPVQGRHFIGYTPHFDLNWVPSNNPCEDGFVADYFKPTIYHQKDHFDVNHHPLLPLTNPHGLRLFTILDGHGGRATRDYLSRVLHPTLAVMLNAIYSRNKTIPSTTGISHYSNPLLAMEKIKLNSGRPLLSGGPVTSEAILKALEVGYLHVDETMLSGAMKYAEALPVTGNPEDILPLLLPVLSPATSGACAITLLVDHVHGDVYLANAGDSRAVAGYWVPGKDGRPGRWECEVLTEDFCGDNSNEVDRIDSEHPMDERGKIIEGGRYFNTLQPTRGFGMGQLKWSCAQFNRVRGLLGALRADMRGIPDQHKTPPYHTVRPQTLQRSLKSGRDGRLLKFIIMATDGLWDRLSSEHAVGLVADHLVSPKKGNVPFDELTKVPDTNHSQSMWREKDLTNDCFVNNPQDFAKSGFAFEDTNAATHLIRNALAGGDKDRLSNSLSWSPPIGRAERDDITCSVIHFEQAAQAPADGPKI